jgi:hypothetical protein
MADVMRGGGRNEGGELEAEALHVQPAVLLHVLPLHLAIAASPATAAAAAGVPVDGSYCAAATLPPALHLSDDAGGWARLGKKKQRDGGKEKTLAIWLVLAAKKGGDGRKGEVG